MIKETARGVKWADYLKWSRVSAVVKQLVAFVLGVLMARAELWQGMAPLGAAFSAGVPMKYIALAAAGSFLGYMLPFSNISALRYSAMLLAIVAIRFILGGINGVRKSAVWSAITAATVVTTVGLVANGLNILSTGAISLAEGLLAGGGAYFIRRASFTKDFDTALTHEQSASLLIAVSLVLTALFSVDIDGITLGRIAALLLILLAAKYGRVGLACVCGIAVALAACLYGFSASFSLNFCLIALATGVFSRISKLAMVISSILVSAIWVIISQADNGSVQMLIETVVASFAFMLLPKTVTAGFGTLVAQPTVTPDTKGLRRTLTMRLSFAAAALQGVSDTVEDVARCLSITKKPNFAGVLNSIENDTCKGCSFHGYCWEKQRRATVDAVLSMSEALRHGQPISDTDIPEEFSERCLRVERFSSSVSKNYLEFKSSISAEKRVSEMRDVTVGQMNGVADMLTELSDEFKTAQKYDIAMAERVSASLREIDICANECSCVIDKFGRLTVEIRLLQTPELPLNRMKILNVIEETCDRDFEPPEINRVARSYYITATEKANFTVDCAYTQFNQGENKHCGDTCRYFYDGRGRMIALISDGMGSGGRAAVDSAMASGLAERLIKAGFGYDCTLKLVNMAMIYKSTDESLATLDISCIDLYSGKTELLKAGAAPTIVRRNGRTGRAECKSLPAGILNEVGFDKAVVTLKEDDILIMMSDGVCTDGTDWICAEAEAWQNGSAKQLADRIATVARRRRQDGHDDDITVFAAIMGRAV